MDEQLKHMWLSGRAFAQRSGSYGFDSDPRRVIPKTLKMVHTASMLGAQHKMEGKWGKVTGLIDNLSLGPGIGVAPTHTLVVTALKEEPSGCLRLRSTNFTFLLLM